MRLPIEIRTCLRDQFSFPVHPLFGQVATVDRGIPDIRTARVYEITPEGDLLLFSHRGANKWRQLSVSNGVAICFLSPWKSHQLIVRGRAHLRRGTQMEWERVRHDVRRIYSQWDVEGPFQREIEVEVSPRAARPFGCIEVQPESWEILTLHPSEYGQSERIRFTRCEEGWQSRRIQVA